MGDSMEYKQVMKELENYGTEQNKKIYTNHGADLEMFGVSVANLKKLFKKIKKNHELGFQLLNSKNIDAMYLSQWLVDPTLLTIEDLETILYQTDYYMVIDNVVANLAARSKDPISILYRWIDSDNHRFRQAAYSLYSLILMSFDNDLIDDDFLNKKLKHVKENIHNEQNRVRYSMNSFLISAGIYDPTLTETCKSYAKDIGKVEVYMGKTSCKVPDALPYIEKVEKMNKIGFKRKL